jgi:hypothetical protein
MSQSEPRQRDDSGATLERASWTRRFTAIGPRLNEAVELYRGLGFEIRLEPAEPRSEEVADRSGCAQCFVMSLARTIYTRPLIAHADADELAAER